MLRAPCPTVTVLCPLLCRSEELRIVLPFLKVDVRRSGWLRQPQF